MWQVILDGLSVFSEKWPLVLGTVVFTCLGCGLVFILPRYLPKRRSFPGSSVWFLVFYFALSLILRLAFVTATFVPPYFDSVEHYRIIKELMMGMETSSLLTTLPSLTPSYYHLGFHILASLLAFGLHANPMDVILILGQVFLTAIPIPLYVLIRSETKSDKAALFGTLLAGFGWYMPGFAVNWGKYPAIAGLYAFEIVLCIAYYIFRKPTKRIQTPAIGILVLSIIVSTIFHTRTLAVIIVTLVSWLVANRLRTHSNIIQYLSLGLFLAGLLILGIVIQLEPLLNLALEPYLKDGLWITLTVLIISPFALIKFPQGVYFSVLFSILILAALFIPIRAELPALEDQTLLDRPFVEMLLYLPLSILGGLGLAGFLKFVSDTKALTAQKRPYARTLIAIMFIGFTGMTSVSGYNFYPSDCCNFVQYDDTIAIDWLERSTPPDASILIASTQMHVLPSGPSANSVGTDAGIWITPLTGRNTVFMPFDIDFRSPDTQGQLCQKKIDYVYVGDTDQSFNISQVKAKKDWYEPILSLPDTNLFRVTGCLR